MASQVGAKSELAAPLVARTIESAALPFGHSVSGESFAQSQVPLLLPINSAIAATTTTTTTLSLSYMTTTTTTRTTSWRQKEPGYTSRKPASGCRWPPTRVRPPTEPHEL